MIKKNNKYLIKNIKIFKSKMFLPMFVPKVRSFSKTVNKYLF